MKPFHITCMKRKYPNLRLRLFCVPCTFKRLECEKELLEVHTNAKIIDIKQAPDNYQQISLIIEMEPLPALVEWSDKYTDLEQNKLNIGLSYSGVVGMDLERQPHAFIAGETGSGKSNVLKCMIHQALIKNMM